MKKLLFGIFAHPDDETFGPCGTFLMKSASGTEVHLISLTLGEAGHNPDGVPDLPAVREQEWRRAGKQMGATSMHTLGYQDGHLDNDNLQQINEQLVSIISAIVSAQPTPVEIEFMTFELNGLSGHIDHIVASRAASYAFYQLKSRGMSLSRILYYCKTSVQAPCVSTNWLFSNKGYGTNQVGETIDAREYRDTIINIMRLHRSQREDCEWHLANRKNEIGLDHFLVEN